MVQTAEILDSGGSKCGPGTSFQQGFPQKLLMPAALREVP
jgi:hypothetical protein